MRVLAIAAHPDDECLGAGGTLASHVLAGDTVYVLFMTRGVTARTGGTQQEAEALSFCAREACSQLGANVHQLELPDNRLDGLDLLDIVKAIEEEIALLSPEVIYTHHDGDRNLDHRRVADAVQTAVRPVPGCSVKKILAFEVPSSTEWGQGFQPNVFVNIDGEAWFRKMRALHKYQSEMRDFPHSRSLLAVNALSTWRGATVGLPCAEAFMLIREIR